MDDYQNKETQQEYEVLLANIKDLEKQIIPQLEMLGKQIPEIYKGYANVVRESVNTALNILSLNEHTSNNIQLAAEIGARTMEAFGAWKAARQHNKMLDKFMSVKQSIAALNQSKIEKALNEADENLQRVKRLFTGYINMSYDLRGKDNETIHRISNLMLRQLVLYRTNYFLVEMCKYLKAEYKAWSNNQQTSSVPQTDYFIVNNQILKNLFGKNIFHALETAGDSDGQLTGAQIMLLADPQFSVFSLKDTICRIHYDQTSAPVRALLNNNPGFPYYMSQVNPMIEVMTDRSIHNIYIYSFIAFAAVVAICLWLIPGEWWSRTLIGIIASAAIWRIAAQNSKKIKIAYVTETLEQAAQVDDDIESYCGKVEVPQIDYTRKNALSESLKTFFN